MRRSRRTQRSVPAPLAGGDRGVALIEVLVGGLVLAAAVAGFAAGTAMALGALERAGAVASANAALIGKVDELRGAPFAALPGQFGPVGGLPLAFDVPGLRTVPGDADGRVGEIVLFLDERASVPEVGLPRDLNGDGDALDANVSGTARILPARVRVSWRTPNGEPRSEAVHVLLARP